jgi:phage gp36-like protein
MYCTVADLQKRLDPQRILTLSDDDANGVPDEDVINAVIADADALIDTYLRVRYTVPLDPTPDLVHAISTSIALYYLLARHNDIVPAEFVKRYDAAVQLLDHIARGLVSIGAAQPSTSPYLP